jgi:Flp pilus assembly protein TadB
MSPGVLPALAAAAAAALVMRPRVRRPPPSSPASPVGPGGGDERGWLHRWRGLWALLARLGGATFVSGTWGVPAGVLLAVLAWMWIGRSEPGCVRRRREAAARELPGFVHLLATALEAGCDVTEALTVVCDAFPGPAARLVAGVPLRLELGVPPEVAWRPLLDEPELAPLARAMVRTHRSGSSITHEVARLADELERRAYVRMEERARAVGVKAAVPLGLCLLPAFLLVGVVPLVVGLVQSLAW